MLTAILIACAIWLLMYAGLRYEATHVLPKGDQ